MAITPDRLLEITEILNVWRYKDHATKKEMQRLIGKLQFVSKCVRSGRVFISRLLIWMHGLGDCEYKKINDEVRKDIRWWEIAIRNFPGTSLIWHLALEDPDTELASDANLTGCGAHSVTEFYHTLFPPFVLQQTSHISQREILTIAVTLKVFAAQIQGKKLIFYCDNQASVECVNSGRTRDKYMLKVLREIAYLSMKHEFLIRARFLDTKKNRPADILSRWNDIKEPRKMFYQSLGCNTLKEITVNDDLFLFTNDW